MQEPLTIGAKSRVDKKLKQYQTLYENLAHKELSHLADSVSLGRQGKAPYLPFFVYRLFYIYFILVGCSLVDNFSNTLKDMASSMRREKQTSGTPILLFSLHPKPDITLVQLHTLEILH